MYVTGQIQVHVLHTTQINYVIRLNTPITDQIQIIVESTTILITGFIPNKTLENIRLKGKKRFIRIHLP